MQCCSLTCCLPHYMLSGLAKFTLKMYGSAYSYFTSFCTTFYVAVLPVNIAIICTFEVYCFKVCKMQPSSIERLITCTQFHLCFLYPTTNTNSLLLSGLKREKPCGKDSSSSHSPTSVQISHFIIERVLQSLF